MAEGEEKFIAEFHGVRHKKQEGVLLLTSARVAWSSGNVFQINYPYHQIRGTLHHRYYSSAPSQRRLEAMMF